MHKPFAYHAGARRSFPGGDNAKPQTAKQLADKGCTIVHIKWCLQVDIPEAQKPRAKTIGSHQYCKNPRVTAVMHPRFTWLDIGQVKAIHDDLKCPLTPTIWIGPYIRGQVISRRRWCSG